MKQDSSTRNALSILATVLVTLVVLGNAAIYAAAQGGPVSSQTGTFQLHFMDVGQGDGALLISPHGETVLFDDGVWGQCNKPVAYLQRLGIVRINYLVISHYQRDHFGCTADVLRTAPLIKNSFDRGDKYPGPAFQRYRDSVGVKRETARVGQLIQLDSSSGDPVTITFKALNGNGVQTNNENDRSIVALISYEDFQAEIGGDLGGFKENDYEDIESGVAPEIGQVEVY